MKYFNFINCFLFFLLFFKNSIASNNININEFLNKIHIHKYNNDISILNINDDLIIYNGSDTLGFYNKKNKQIIKFEINDNDNLVRITNNKEYIVIAFNNFYGKILIINKTTGNYSMFFVNYVINDILLLPNNRIIIVDLFNTMNCYNINKQQLWSHKYAYSKIFNNITNNLLYKNNKIYWLFDKNMIYILNSNNGNIEDTIVLKNEFFIKDLIFYNNNLIVITNKGVMIYHLLSLQIIFSIKNIYPISQGIIHNDTLYFHDNKFLLGLNLINYKFSKLLIKKEKKFFELLNPIKIHDYIIIPTKIGRWYLVNKNTVKKVNGFKYWSYIAPCNYNNQLIFYKNFSNKYFDVLDLSSLIKI